MALLRDLAKTGRTVNSLSLPTTAKPINLDISGGGHNPPAELQTFGLFRPPLHRGERLVHLPRLRPRTRALLQVGGPVLPELPQPG